MNIRSTDKSLDQSTIESAFRSTNFAAILPTYELSKLSAK
jgi:hypothetical protein